MKIEYQRQAEYFFLIMSLSVWHHLVTNMFYKVPGTTLTVFWIVMVYSMCLLFLHAHNEPCGAEHSTIRGLTIHLFHIQSVGLTSDMVVTSRQNAPSNGRSW